jgi:hypothetical protein
LASRARIILLSFFGPHLVHAETDKSLRVETSSFHGRCGDHVPLIGLNHYCELPLEGSAMAPESPPTISLTTGYSFAGDWIADYTLPVTGIPTVVRISINTCAYCMFQ